MTIDLKTGLEPGPESARPEEREFDLDISFIESDAGLSEFLRLTDDGCGSTCESACNSCP